MKINVVGVPMTSLRSLALVAAALTLGACSTFQPKSAVEESATNVTLNSSWHARIASPSELAGAVQMNGSASMAPGTKRGTTEVAMNSETHRRAACTLGPFTADSVARTREYSVPWRTTRRCESGPMAQVPREPLWRSIPQPEATTL